VLFGWGGAQADALVALAVPIPWNGAEGGRRCAPVVSVGVAIAVAIGRA